MNRRALGIAGSLLFSAALLLSAANGQNSSGGAAKGDAAKGKEVFEQCSVCHNIDSPEKKMGPSLQGLYKKKTMTTGKAVTDQNVLSQINNGGNGMPAYSDMLSAEDKANLIAYLHTI